MQLTMPPKNADRNGKSYKIHKIDRKPDENKEEAGKPASSLFLLPNCEVSASRIGAKVLLNCFWRRDSLPVA